MSISIALALATASVAAPAVVHDTVVEHRGASYQVSYRPHLITQTKTVGAVTGTRMSQQRCRWTAIVQVQRHVSRAGDNAPADKILPASRTIQGDRHGSCDGAGDTIHASIAAQDSKVREHVLAVAAADKGTVLADIDAAHRLASN